MSEPTAGDAFQSKVLTLLASESTIDILGIYGTSLYQRYVELEALTPLKELIEEAGMDTIGLGACLSQLEISDEFYALPHRKSVEVLYYNQEIFDECAIAYPEQLTWDEFEALAKELTYTREDGRDVVGAGGDLRFWATTDTHALAAQYGESMVDDELPHFLSCLERLNRIFSIDKSTSDYAEMIAMGNAGQTELFIGGQMAMMFSADFMLSILSGIEAIEFDWNIAYLPIDADEMEPGTSYGGVTGTGITSFCEHKAEAFEFLAYLCGAEGAAIIAGEGTLPAYTDETVQAAFSASQSPDKNVDVFSTSNPMVATILHDKASDLIEMQREQIELMLIGDQTVEETYENWNTLRKEILSAK